MEFGCTAEIEVRNLFGSRGDPTAIGTLEVNQNVRDFGSGARVLVPALLDQYPDIFGQAENVPVHRPWGSLSSESQDRCHKLGSIGERSFVREDLQKRSVNFTSPGEIM